MKKGKKSQSANVKQSSFGYIVLIGAGLLIVGAIAWFVLKPAPVVDPELAKARVPVNIVPPETFSGRVREAYQAAKDVPGVLEQMPCYCGCMQDGSGHNNNLFCFIDNHAVG